MRHVGFCKRAFFPMSLRKIAELKFLCIETLSVLAKRERPPLADPAQMIRVS